MSPQNYDNQNANPNGKHNPNASPQPHGQADGSSQPPTDPTSRFHANLAHEMANLLDGSLRNVALVMASLRDVQQRSPSDSSSAQPPAAADSPSEDSSADPSSTAAGAKPTLPPPSPELVRRLETADIAMRQMAQMIQQLLQGHEGQPHDNQPHDNHPQSNQTNRSAAATPIYAAADTFSLTQAAEHVMRLLKPIADEQHIALELLIDDQAGQLPVGPLFPVIVNAVRNSLQAIAAYQDTRDSTQRAADIAFAVQVSASICEEAQQPYLKLTITDNGPGLDPVTLDEHGRFVFGASTRAQGHGLGLPLARDIVKTLGGEIDITGPGRGPQSAMHDSADPQANAFTQRHGQQGTQLVVMVPLHRLATINNSPAVSPNP